LLAAFPIAMFLEGYYLLELIFVVITAALFLIAALIPDAP
jgi:hypothetical protein